MEPSKETNVTPPASARVRFHLHPPHRHHPHHPRHSHPHHSLTASTSCYPQSLCLQFVSGREGIQQFFEHSRCLSPQLAASPVVSAESGQAGEGGEQRHGPVVGGRVGGEQHVIRCGRLLLFLGEPGRLRDKPFLDVASFLAHEPGSNAPTVLIPPVSR